MPQVSVIIPARNATRFIRRAVVSVLAQSHPPSETVIVDDDSEDDLVGALAPYGEKLRLVSTDRRGAARARNRGIDATGGDCLAFLDADDYWEPDKLARQLEMLNHHPGVDIVSSNFFLDARQE